MQGKNILHKSIKKFDNQLRIYPTLKCNLKCPYCVNEQGKVRASESDYKYRSAEEWSYAINKIGKNVVFTGGEPTLYPEFIDLVMNINSEINISIYSNLKFDIDNFINNVKRPIRFLISYHPFYGSVDLFIKNLLKLMSVKNYSITVHSILWEKQEKAIRNIYNAFKEAGIKLNLDSDQLVGFEGANQKSKTKGECRRSIILIAPDGTRYPCVSKLVRQIEPMENIIDEQLGNNSFINICNDFGYCAPCDALGETEMVKL